MHWNVERYGVMYRLSNNSNDAVLQYQTRVILRKNKFKKITFLTHADVLVFVLKTALLIVPIIGLFRRK